jgi:MoaA/NifB/PqqE/SkfB family radical SAM enzyme
MTAIGNTHDAAVTSDLSFLWLEVTGKCNLFCSHCYADSSPQADLYGDMTYSDWTRVLDEAAELGCRSVQFIGGEPTMHPRLGDLVDHANHTGFEFIEVYTNATRLGKKLLGCFQRNSVHLATSFYSDDPVVHEQLTGDEGSWQRTVTGIENALAAGLAVRVGVIETGRNLGHGERAVAYLRTLGIQKVRIDRERGVGRATRDGHYPEGERYDELCGECWDGKLCVTCSGETFPCVFARATPLGNVKSGLAAILRSTTLAGFRRTVRSFGGDEQQCNPLSSCNPDNCNPNACNPDDCNPLGSNCNPCNPCGPA